MSETLKKIYNKDYYYNAADWGEGYKNYENFSTKEGNTWHFLVEKILKEKTQGKVLDIGCAFGYFVNFFPDSFEKYGTDISDYAVEQSKINVPNGKFVVSDISATKPFEEKFDVITSLDTLEHTLNLRSALENIDSMLKDDGTLIVAVPIASRMHQLLGFFGKSFLTTMSSHITLTSDYAWREIILAEKFRVVEDYPITWGKKYHWPFHLFHVFVLKKK